MFRFIRRFLVSLQFALFPIWRLRRSGAIIGKNVYIGGSVYIELENAHLLRIDDGATVSAYTKIILHDSSINNVKKGPIKYGKVNIGKNSYIGADTLILPGTNIGSHVIVGAGSLVKGYIKKDSVYIGRPAKFYCKTSVLLKKWQKSNYSSLIYLKEENVWHERTS